MANATSTQLQELYVAYFGRAADPTGLDYWTKKGISTADFAADMYAQAEFKDAYGSLSTEAQVNQIYKNLFDREADVDGLNYWTLEINLGNIKLAEIANHLIYAAQNNAGSETDKTALTNRTNAAVAYTAKVKESTTAILAFQAQSTDPWVAGVNITEAVSYLSGIDADTAHTAAGVASSVSTITANGTPSEAKSFTLTTGIDSFTGGNAADTFTAANTATNAANQTFNTGDSLVGGGGSDTLDATIGVAATYQANNVSGIETINGTFGAAGTISLLGSTGVTTVNSNASTAAAIFTNIASTDVALKATSTDQNATYTFTSTAVSGTADSATLTLSNVTAGTHTIAGIETLNIVSSGGPNALTALTAAAATTINVSGGQTLDLGTFNAVATTISAAEATAGLTVISNNTSAATVTGGSGNDVVTFTEDTAAANKFVGGAGDDKVTFTANLGTTDSISGGAGTDTLIIEDDSNATGYSTPTTRIIDGFEKLEIGTALAASLTVANIQEGITEVIFDDDVATGLTLTLEAGTQQVEFEAAAFADGESFTVTDTGSATNDTLTFENGLATASVWTDVDLTINGFETFNVLTTSTGAKSTQNIDDITMTPDTGGTATFKASGTNKLTTAAITADVIDASGLTAASSGSTFTMGTPVGVESITGSAGNDTLTGDASSSIDGGAGSDSITGGSGNDTLVGGAGADTITSGAGNDTISAGAGNDTITVGDNITQADTIDGGAGTDTISITGASSSGISALNALSVSNVTTLNANISNIENMSISSALNVSSFDVARLDSISNITLAAGYTGAETLSGLADGASITLATADTGGASALTLTLASTSGSSDSVTVNLENDSSTDFDALTIASVENITLTTAEATATTTVEVHTVDMTAAALTTLTVTGTEGLNLMGANVTASTVDASGVKGLGIKMLTNGVGVTYTGSSKVDVVAGGVGADTISGAGGADQLSGGTGADSIVGGAGADTLSGGAGNDTIDLGASDSSIDVYTSLGGSGTTNIDTIQNFNAGSSAGDILALHNSTYQGADFIKDDTSLVANITTNTTAAAANSNIFTLTQGKFANAAAISTALASGGSVTFGSGISSGGVGHVVLVYQASTGGDARIATAQVADAGGVDEVVDVAVLSGVTDITSLVAGNFNLDDLFGHAGADTLAGSAGAETIYAGHGVDSINSGVGADIISLETTYDVGSADTILMTQAATLDTITGFTAGTSGDLIQIDISEFVKISSVTSGTLDQLVAFSATATIEDVAATDTVSFATIDGDNETTAVFEAAELLLLDSATATFANVAIAVDAFEIAGAHTLVHQSDITTADAFLFAYENGTEVRLALASVIASDDNSASASGITNTNLRGVDLAVLSGVTDVSTLVAANLDFV